MVPAGANGLPDLTRRHIFVSDAADPVDLQIGPEGDLYYADLGGGTIRRVRYTQTPSAVATAQPRTGPAPLTVDFDGRGSSDPGGAAHHLRVGPRR